MERGRSVGSYFLFLLREGLHRLRRELWGLRGLLALFIVFYLVIDLFGAMESERTTMGQGIAAVWMVLLFCYCACFALAFRSRIMAMIQEAPLKIDPNTAVEPMMV